MILSSGAQKQANKKGWQRILYLIGLILQERSVIQTQLADDIDWEKCKESQHEVT